jgi:hypothetical protein
MDIVASDFQLILASPAGDELALLTYDDWLVGAVQDMLRIAPEFAGLEPVTYVGGGAKVFERGGGLNRFHTIEFTRMRRHDTVTDAKLFQLRHYSEITAGGGDLTISLQNRSGTAILKNACIINAPSYTIECFSVFTYQIKGGRIESTLSTDADILDETGDEVLGETGSVLQQG